MKLKFCHYSSDIDDTERADISSHVFGCDISASPYKAAYKMYLSVKSSSVSVEVGACLLHWSFFALEKKRVIYINKHDLKLFGQVFFHFL